VCVPQKNARTGQVQCVGDKEVLLEERLGERLGHAQVAHVLQRTLAIQEKVDHDEKVPGSPTLPGSADAASASSGVLRCAAHHLVVRVHGSRLSADGA
jgi:hypothetical protein